MQDGFVGDVGDFGKYGLLRVLAGIEPEAKPRFSLGVVWYVPDHATAAATKASYGQHLNYLKEPDVYQPCDPALFTALSGIVTGRRQIDAVEASGLLGEDAQFYSTPIPQSSDQREAWLKGALHHVASASIVFLDPDIGLASQNMEQRPKQSSEHVHRVELEAFTRQEHAHTVVVYQHHARTPQSRKGQVDSWKEMFRRLALPEQPRILRFEGRDFVILPLEEHAQAIDERVAVLLSSPWRRLFRRYGAIIP